MKKYIGITSAGLLSAMLLLAGCTQSEAVEPLSAENLEAHFGENVYEVMKAVGADQDRAEDSADHWMIKLDEKYRYGDSSSEIVLNYENKKDRLFKCAYYFDDPKAAYDYAMELSQYFMDRYGDPDSHSNHTLLELNSFEEITYPNEGMQEWRADWPMDTVFEGLAEHPMLKLSLSFQQETEDMPAVNEVAVRFYEDPNARNRENEGSL